MPLLKSEDWEPLRREPQKVGPKVCPALRARHSHGQPEMTRRLVFVECIIIF
jgi:hypothetical protein